MGGRGTREGEMPGTDRAERTARALGQPCLARGQSKSKSKDAPPTPPKILFPGEIASLSALFPSALSKTQTGAGRL